MALFITYCDLLGRDALLQWHVSDNDKPTVGTARATEYVQADGDELAYIRARFQDLPKPFRCDQQSEYATRLPAAVTNNPTLNHWPLTVYWFGDQAKFIVANL